MSERKVQMMHDERYMHIKRDDANGVDVAEIPYKGGRFCMYIALPQSKDGLTNLEKLLSQTNSTNDLFSGLSRVKVDLAIPNFKTESLISLKTALQSLGMVRAFEFEVADFDGISQVEKGNIFINQVLHKAVIEVDETGDIATEYMEGLEKHLLLQHSGDEEGSYLPVYGTPLEKFTADHPFVYFLRDNRNGQILFQGKFSG